MSNTIQETIADIVAEMRKDIAEGTVGIWSDFGGEIARRYADRIEEAHQREVAELRECLKEAIKKQCKHKECKDNACFFVEFGKENECIVHKWRQALKGASND